MQLRNRWTAEGSVVPVAWRRRHNSGICHQFACTSADPLRCRRHVIGRLLDMSHVGYSYMCVLGPVGAILPPQPRPDRVAVPAGWRQFLGRSRYWDLGCGAGADILACGGVSAAVVRARGKFIEPRLRQIRCLGWVDGDLGSEGVPP